MNKDKMMIEIFAQQIESDDLMICLTTSVLNDVREYLCSTVIIADGTFCLALSCIKNSITLFEWYVPITQFLATILTQCKAIARRNGETYDREKYAQEGNMYAHFWRISFQQN